MLRDIEKAFSATTKPKYDASVVSFEGRTHIVEDVLGTRHSVDSDVQYRPGTRVVVIGGQIVGQAGTGKIQEIIEV